MYATGNTTNCFKKKKIFNFKLQVIADKHNMHAYLEKKLIGYRVKGMIMIEVCYLKLLLLRKM